MSENGKKYSELLSLVIPVFNSEKSISIVVDNINKTLSGKIKYEIIIINDYSTDNSYSKCKALAEKHDFIKLIDLSKNFGQHNAIIAGLHYARGGLVVCMDDDMQTPPQELWKLIDKIKEGYDVVYANYLKKMHSLPRNISSRLKNLILRIFLKKSGRINVTSYFIIKRFLVKEIIKYSGPFPFMGGLILRATDNIGTVYVEHQKRVLGKSSYRWQGLLNLVLNAITNMTIVPLRLSFLVGIFCSLTGFIFALIFFIRKLIHPYIIMGYTSTIIAILFFSGISLITIGIIGEYVGRTFLHINKHPQFIIKETVNIYDTDNNVQKPSKGKRP